LPQAFAGLHSGCGVLQRWMPEDLVDQTHA
jgi:hypothetical protein